LTQLLALEQSGGRTGALLSRIIDRTVTISGFFYRVFELPLLRNAQKRDKKIESNNRGMGGGDKITFFVIVMSPEQKFFCVSEFPLLRNAKR
jgi:hypothetical protein